MYFFCGSTVPQGAWPSLTQIISVVPVEKYVSENGGGKEGCVHDDRMNILVTQAPRLRDQIAVNGPLHRVLDVQLVLLEIGLQHFAVLDLARELVDRGRRPVEQLVVVHVQRRVPALHDDA